jgi:hypothetical protein
VPFDLMMSLQPSDDNLLPHYGSRHICRNVVIQLYVVVCAHIFIGHTVCSERVRDENGNNCEFTKVFFCVANFIISSNMYRLLDNMIVVIFIYDHINLLIASTVDI